MLRTPASIMTTLLLRSIRQGEGSKSPDVYWRRSPRALRLHHVVPSVRQLQWFRPRSRRTRTVVRLGKTRPSCRRQAQLFPAAACMWTYSLPKSLPGSGAALKKIPKVRRATRKNVKRKRRLNRGWAKERHVQLHCFTVNIGTSHLSRIGPV